MVLTDLEPLFAMLREIRPNPVWQAALREELSYRNTEADEDDVTFPTIVRLNS